MPECGGVHSAFCVSPLGGPPMRLRLSALLALFLTTSGPVMAQDRSPSFVSTSSELVVLPVTVSNKQGGFVADLPQHRFTVYDNGRRQEVALFSNEDTPVTVGLVIDISGSMKAKLPEVVIAAATFMRRSNPQDEMFTVAFNDRVVERGIGRTSWVASDAKAFESDLRSLVAQGRTALYDGLSDALDRMTLASRPRKALILISDGGDNASRSTLDQILMSARRSNVTIYTVGLFDLDDPDRNPGALKSLAQSTGGVRFLPRSPSELVQACERIARELRSGYTIGYTPPDRDGAFHRIRVEVTANRHEKLQVRTRPGYFAANAAVKRP